MSVPPLSDLIVLEKPSQSQEFSFSTACRSKQTLWNRGWKKEFVQANLFVQKAGNKIVIDIALVLSIFRNSFKVRLINMALIAKVCRKRVWLLSGDSDTLRHPKTHPNPTGGLLAPPFPQTTQLRYLPFFSSFRLERLIKGATLVKEDYALVKGVFRTLSNF